MVKIQILIITLFLILFSGCSTTAVNVAPTNEAGTAIQVEPVSDFYLEVGEQEYNDYSYIHKFGRNDDIDSGSGFEAIWNGGGDYTGFPDGAETMEIRSNDADDTYGGAGAWTVKISGLQNLSHHSMPDVYVNLSGTTWVTLDANLYHRASRISVTASGSTSAVNEGTLTLRHTTTTANIFAKVPVGYGSTMISALTIPIDSKAFLNSWYASMGNKVNGVSTIRLMMREDNGVWQVKEEFSILADGTSYVERQYKVPKNNIAGGTDIKIMADSSVNNLGISAGMDFILEATE